jgi:hypothetical protein
VNVTLLVGFLMLLILLPWTSATERGHLAWVVGREASTHG